MLTFISEKHCLCSCRYRSSFLILFTHSIYHRPPIVLDILVLVLATGLFLALSFYVGINAEKNSKSKSDAILVLGAKAYRGDSYNPCLVSRINHAVELYKNKYASKILLSGGNDKEDGINEAEIMKKIVMSSGVSSKDILLEKSSTSTFENLLNSQHIMKVNNFKSIIIVTEPFHAARVSLVAHKLNLNYSISPASTSSCWQQWRYFSRYFLKEPFAIMQYKLTNKL